MFHTFTSFHRDDDYKKFSDFKLVTENFLSMHADDTIQLQGQGGQPSFVCMYIYSRSVNLIPMQAWERG